MKKTPWIPGNVKPVRVGVYERQCSPREKVFSRWDGESWCANRIIMSSAAVMTMESYLQQLPWRGLAQDPSKR